MAEKQPHYSDYQEGGLKQSVAAGRRDAAFTLYGVLRIGFTEEAARFRY